MDHSGKPENYTEAMQVIAALKRDINDMRSSPAAVFVRCSCGRVKTKGWTCPTEGCDGTSS